MALDCLSRAMIASNATFIIIAVYWTVTSWTAVVNLDKSPHWLPRSCLVESKSVNGTHDHWRNEFVVSNFTLLTDPAPQGRTIAFRHATADYNQSRKNALEFDALFNPKASYPCWLFPPTPSTDPQVYHVAMSAVHPGATPAERNVALMSTLLTAAASVALLGVLACAARRRARLPAFEYAPAGPLAPSEAAKTTALSGALIDKLCAATADGEGSTGNDVCAICLDDENSMANAARLSCGHSFHPLCLRRWLLRGGLTCPLCCYKLEDDGRDSGEPGAAGSEANGQREVLTSGDVVRPPCPEAAASSVTQNSSANSGAREIHNSGDAVLMMHLNAPYPNALSRTLQQIENRCGGETVVHDSGEVEVILYQNSPSTSLLEAENRCDVDRMVHHSKDVELILYPYAASLIPVPIESGCESVMQYGREVLDLQRESHASSDMPGRLCLTAPLSVWTEDLTGDSVGFDEGPREEPIPGARSGTPSWTSPGERSAHSPGEIQGLDPEASDFDAVQNALVESLRVTPSDVQFHSLRIADDNMEDPVLSVFPATTSVTSSQSSGVSGMYESGEAMQNQNAGTPHDNAKQAGLAESIGPKPRDLPFDLRNVVDDNDSEYGFAWLPDELVDRTSPEQLDFGDWWAGTAEGSESAESYDEEMRELGSDEPSLRMPSVEDSDGWSNRTSRMTEDGEGDELFKDDTPLLLSQSSGFVNVSVQASDERNPETLSTTEDSDSDETLVNHVAEMVSLEEGEDPPQESFAWLRGVETQQHEGRSESSCQALNSVVRPVHVASPSLEYAPPSLRVSFQSPSCEQQASPR